MSAAARGGQHLTFEMTNAMCRSPGLEPLMRELGLGHHHGSLMRRVLRSSSAPASCCRPERQTVTVRPTQRGIELRLDVDLDRLP